MLCSDVRNGPAPFGRDLNPPNQSNDMRISMCLWALLAIWPLAGYGQDLDPLTPAVPDSVYFDAELFSEQRHYEDGRYGAFDSPITLVGRSGSNRYAEGKKYLSFGAWLPDKADCFDYGRGICFDDILQISNNGFQDDKGHFVVTFFAIDQYEEEAWSNFVTSGYIVVGDDTLKFSDGISVPGPSVAENEYNDPIPECAVRGLGEPDEPLICWPDIPVILRDGEFVNVILSAKPFLLSPLNPTELTTWQHRTSSGSRVAGAIWLSWRLPYEDPDPLEQLRLERELGIHYEYRVLRDGDKEWKPFQIKDTRLGNVESPRSNGTYQRRNYLVTGLDPLGEYSFCIRAVNAAGKSDPECNTNPMSPVSVEPGELPGTVALMQNYPNPFNPSTEITYTLPAGEHVRMAVYDMAGREIETFADGFRPAGTHTVRYDATGLSTGAYVYRLVTGSRSVSRIMAIVR